MKKKGILLATILVIVSSGLIGLVLHLGRKPARHSVTLRWDPPAPAKGVTVAGYNVYRSTTSGGPYVKIASHVTGLTDTDWIVNSGTTYYYVATAVDTAGRESTYSHETMAVIP